jgi:hypothetical protein
MSEEGLCLFWAKPMHAQLSHLFHLAFGTDLTYPRNNPSHIAHIWVWCIEQFVQYFDGSRTGLWYYPILQI